MMLLLAPWIVFWIAASIDGFWGSLVSLAVCVLSPVLMQRAKATLYDRISGLGSAPAPSRFWQEPLPSW